jgi:hypothetical protein
MPIFIKYFSLSFKKLFNFSKVKLILKILQPVKECYIKTTLGMELLRTKTPEMAKKEVLIYMLAYNLIRSLIWTAKQIYPIDIQRISFKGTVQHLASLAPYLAIAGQSNYAVLYEKLIYLVANEKVPDRPDRIEPRVIKRRPKPFPLMTQPRSQLKAKLVA